MWKPPHTLNIFRCIGVGGGFFYGLIQPPISYTIFTFDKSCFMIKCILTSVILMMIVVGSSLVPSSCTIQKQRKWLKQEGEQAAIFYFKKGQKKRDSLFMKGVIYAGTLKDIRRVLAQNEGITTIVMEEVPGSVDDEVNLLAAREIRKKGLNTYIPENGWVASGGTDMFLAGQERNIHPKAKLGVHPTFRTYAL